MPLGPEARTGLTKLHRVDGNPWVITRQAAEHARTDLQRPWQRIRETTGL